MGEPATAPASGRRKEDSAHTLPLVWCLVSAGLFGASTPASKVLLDGLTPLVLSGLLYAGGAIAVLPWAMRARTDFHTIDRRNWFYLLGAIGTGGIVGPVLLLTGLSMASAGSVALWLNLEGVATAILARAFFREHVQTQTWIAIVLIVIASALLSEATPRGDVAIVFVALACLAWGLDNNLTASIDRFSPAQVTFAKGLAAGVVNAGTGLALAPAALAPRDVISGLAVGAFAYGASILLYIRGAQQLGATRSQLVFSTAPAFGIVSSWLVLDEPISPLQVLSAAIMAFAIWLWRRERHGHLHAHERLVHAHAHRHDDGHHEHTHAEAIDPAAWHSHEHAHERVQHRHEHRPDLHHRHRH